MGIKDIFRRKKGRAADNTLNNNLQTNTPNFDCVLNYKSGIEAQVSFKNIEEVALDDGTIKRLQSVLVNYDMPDGRFQEKKYYMEPVFDKEGNNVTKENYLSLTSSNMPLIKGFFSKEQLDKEPTNYIGYIDYDKNGKPIRGKDGNFERGYKAMLYRQKLQKQRMDDDRFKRDLKEKVESIKPHIKTSHAEYLGPEQWVNPYRNNNNQPSR